MEMNYWRRCCRLTLKDRVRNDVIRERMKVEKSVVDEIEEKQLQWYGHLRRMSPSRMPKKIYEWIPAERRKRGRPRMVWHQNVEEARAKKRHPGGAMEGQREMAC